jgi:hypothetical protein
MAFTTMVFGGGGGGVDESPHPLAATSRYVRRVVRIEVRYAEELE